MKKVNSLGLAMLVMFVVLFVASCTAGPNPSVGTHAPGAEVADFWLGLWHGFIVVIAFIVSLFDSSVHFYEVHNNGGWYNLAFLMGAGAFGGVASTTVIRRR